MGPGTMRRLLEANIGIFDISHIMLSHFHPDHTAELVPFLFATKYPNERARTDTLTILSGKGFRTFFKGLRNTYGDWMNLETGILDIIELDNLAYDSHLFEQFRVESIPVDHREESVAFKISTPDQRRIVYSGDTDESENLVTLSKGADVLICESAFPDSHKVKGHLTPSRAGQIARRAGVATLVLTHFYPECDQVDIGKECRKTYQGPLILAKDLQRIEI
jgi:ribonuclease BN (tRNA processing enzyme)